MSRDQFFYGGQAVIEGVLMRGRTTYAVAVRRPDGEIQILREKLRSVVYTSPVWKLPFLRGLAGLWEMLHLGMKALVYSANVNAEGEDIELSAGAIRVTIVVAVIGALMLFVGLPLLTAGFLSRGHGSLWFALIDGAVRIALLLGYLYVISLNPRIHTVFQYHGAEHKTINTFEAGLPLDTPSVRAQSTLHPRCGTGFLLAVMVVSAFVYGLVGRPAFYWLILSRLVLIPVIAMLAYEFIRLAGRHRRNPVMQLLLIPFLATQRLTTREPTDPQIEVALEAFRAARREEEEVAA